MWVFAEAAELPKQFASSNGLGRGDEREGSRPM